MDILLLLGVVLIVGFAGGQLARKIKLPSVTGYLLAGIIIGPSVLNIITKVELATFQPINDFALGLIGLSIGGELKWGFIREKWENFSLLFLGEFITTFVLVFMAIYFFTSDFPLALILASLALATAPGAILNVINEKQSKGIFPRVLMSLVALDNLFCIILANIIIIFLNLYYFGGGSESNIVLQLGFEIGLSLIVGLVLGFIVLTILNKEKNKARRQILLTAIFFLSVGIPRQLGISYLFVILLGLKSKEPTLF